MEFVKFRMSCRFLKIKNADISTFLGLELLYTAFFSQTDKK